jgi:hypothetical protein
MAQSGDAPGSQSTTTSQSGIERDIQMLRQDLRSKKKQTIAANLQLSDADATKFWPVYDQYVAELTKINDEKYAVIKEYADAWGNMQDDQALSLINRALAVEERVAQLRIKRSSARLCPARRSGPSSRSNAGCRHLSISSCRRNSH